LKVKVGDKIYDGEKEPVMVVLSEADKQNIQNMADGARCYCCIPKGQSWTNEQIREWMARR